jgi:cobalt-zinc-cadmium efflux system membrane fusion protein
MLPLADKSVLKMDQSERQATSKDQSGSGEEHDHHPVPSPGRRLPLAAQGVVLLVFGGIMVAVLFVLPAIVGFAAPAGNDDQAPASAAFKPTDQQWAGLKIRRVTQEDYAPQVEAEGRIAVDDDLSTPVISPYSGRVTRVFARAGDVVAAGAPLFAVQSTELAQAKNDMVSALATLRTAHAQLELATANERRQHLLFIGHGAAQRDWQQSLVDLATAKGGLNSAEIAVAAVRARLTILGLTKREIAGIEDAPDPEHENADTVVRAPIAGTITQRQVSPGQTIVGAVTSSGASGAVFTIGNLSKLWMIASAREEDAGRFHLGDLAKVSVPAFPGRSFNATVTYLAPVIDPSTHRLLVRAEVPNQDGALKPDMLATFVIFTGAAAPILAVPANAVVFEGADAHVWVADPANKTLALRKIDAGTTSNGMVEVLHGLLPTESVVTSGAVFIDRTLSDS